MSIESLDRMERKVRRLVGALEEVRQENQRLRGRLGVEVEPPAASSGKAAEVERQLRLLEEERSAIRDRVERAISMLEEAS